MERTYVGRQIYADRRQPGGGPAGGHPDQPPPDADLHRQRRLSEHWWACWSASAGSASATRASAAPRLGARRDRRVRSSAACRSTEGEGPHRRRRCRGALLLMRLINNALHRATQACRRSTSRSRSGWCSASRSVAGPDPGAQSRPGADGELPVFGAAGRPTPGQLTRFGETAEGGGRAARAPELAADPPATDPGGRRCSRTPSRRIDVPTLSPARVFLASLASSLRLLRLFRPLPCLKPQLAAFCVSGRP